MTEKPNRQLDRLRTKVMFQASEIESLKKQRKEMRREITKRHANAEKKQACANCEAMKARMERALTEKKSRNSMQKVLRKWYPEDYARRL